MLRALLLLALAQLTAPGIYVDEDGFVTLTEPLEVREQERRNLGMLEEADSAYREYRTNREGDLAKLIDMHKAILESGMVLAPALHQRNLKRLAELHREYAKGEAPEDRRAVEKLHERIEEGMSQGSISNEDLELLNNHYHGSHRRDHLSQALGYEEAVVALMTSEENISAAWNAPITPEMLTTLRASKETDASKDPARAVPVFQGEQLISVEHPKHNATVSSSARALENAYGILICSESAPTRSNFRTTFTFEFSIQANERLIDALERLVEATDNQVCWRLLEGRVVLTAMPRDNLDQMPIGDRRVRVDIRADSFMEAFRQLEQAYNLQHKDVPFVVEIMNYELAHLRAGDGESPGSEFRLQGEFPLRNSIIALLNQLDIPQSSYLLAASNAIQNQFMRIPGYYHEQDLYYYVVSFHGTPAQREAAQRERRGEYSEEVSLWVGDQFPEMTRRVLQYFDRIYPGLAAMENKTDEEHKEQPVVHGIRLRRLANLSRSQDNRDVVNGGSSFKPLLIG